MLTDSLQSQQCLLRTQQHLNTYARQGLRVLVMARRKLSSAQFAEWNMRLEEAELLHETQERRLLELYYELECNLSLLGKKYSLVSHFVFFKFYMLISMHNMLCINNKPFVIFFTRFLASLFFVYDIP